MFETPTNSQGCRRVLLFIVLLCSVLMGYALVLQYVQGIMPCPMCIVQRYLFTVVALFAAIAWAIPAKGKATRGARRFCMALAMLSAVAGAIVAARNSWIQWNPPPFMSCGRDFYSMIVELEISRSIPLIFQGSGDCAAIDWTFLGLSIANYSFLSFALFILLLTWAWRKA